MNKFQILKLNDLPQKDGDTWQAICDQNLRFQNPFFQPSFARCVNQAHPGVSLVVAEQDGCPAAFMPIQTYSSHRAGPVGGKLNDLQGMVVGPDLDVDVHAMLQATGLKSFAFHAAQKIGGFEKHQFESAESPIIDLSSGYGNYFSWVTANSRTVKKQGQKTRKMLSELGPLRFEFDCRDRTTFKRVIEMKRQKYRRTKTFDLFSLDWAKRLIELIFETQESKFAGVLSVLWAGDHLVAGHLGIRSCSKLHYWFPIFDPRFRQYSPGIQLVLEISRAAFNAGLIEFDLGYGDQPFKYKLANSGYQIVCGKLADSRLAFAASRQFHFTRKWLLSRSLRPHVKYIVRSINPSFGHWVFR